MEGIHVVAVAEKDGEVRFENLPCRKGDSVEAIVLLPPDVADRDKRLARQRLLDHIRSHKFRSEGPYPTRDELHERH